MRSDAAVSERRCSCCSCSGPPLFPSVYCLFSRKRHQRFRSRGPIRTTDGGFLVQALSGKCPSLWWFCPISACSLVTASCCVVVVAAALVLRNCWETMRFEQLLSLGDIKRGSDMFCVELQMKKPTRHSDQCCPLLFININMTVFRQKTSLRRWSSVLSSHEYDL